MRQFKKSFGFVILTIILTSFKFDNGFIIKGHIDGIEEGTWIKLYDFEQQLYLDSAVSENGNFILKGKVECPTTCWVQCKNEYAIVQVENTEMTFSSPIKDMHLYCAIKGGAEQELGNDLHRLQFPYDKLTYSAYDSLMNIKNLNDNDKQRLIKILNESQDLARNIYINFGKSHPNSYLGLDAIYRNRTTILKDTLKLIYENLTPEFKLTSLAKALNVFLYGELAQKGKPFIDFNVKTIKGEDFSLSLLKGKFVYLSFWSSGCGPCRMENKLLSHSINELPKDLSLVSFSTDRNIKAWDIATKTDSIVWYNVSDLEGSNGKIKTQYQVQAIPSSFLIDKDGIIIEQFMGFDTDIVKRIKSLIEGNKK
jgi:thiol-disulfide isomerase/thioredoxin